MAGAGGSGPATRASHGGRLPDGGDTSWRLPADGDGGAAREGIGALAARVASNGLAGRGRWSTRHAHTRTTVGRRRWLHHRCQAAGGGWRGWLLGTWQTRRREVHGHDRARLVMVRTEAEQHGARGAAQRRGSGGVMRGQAAPGGKLRRGRGSAEGLQFQRRAVGGARALARGRATDGDRRRGNGGGALGSGARRGSATEQ